MIQICVIPHEKTSFNAVMFREGQDPPLQFIRTINDHFHHYTTRFVQRQHMNEP